MTDERTAAAGSAKPGARPGWIGRAILGALVAVALANFYVVLRGPGASGAGTRGSGAVAPAFAGLLMTGDHASLGDYSGKVVLLDFWATWCLPCVVELPTLDALQRRFAGAGRPFTVLGINSDGEEAQRDRILAFTHEHKLSYPSFLDDGSIAGKYGVETIPHLVLIDRKGRVQRVYTGRVSESELVGVIEPLLR